jgi:hypothetical protein
MIPQKETGWNGLELCGVINHMTIMENPKPPDYSRIALQSALAAALFLGFPAGLLLWLILFRAASETAVVDPFVKVLQAHGLNKIIVLMVFSLGWSFSLAKISGYRSWWKIGFATVLGIILGWLSPLSNLDALPPEGTPVHVVYAVAMSGIVGSATLSVGLIYGLILRSIKAALTMALTTSFISVLALLLTIFIFDQFGIRVGGEVPFAMSKVTTVSLMISAIASGAVLGIGFGWFVESGSRTVRAN